VLARSQGRRVSREEEGHGPNIDFFFSSRRRHTRSDRDWSSDVCSSDLVRRALPATLVLAGDGPERDLAEQEVDRLKLRGDVRFLGKVDQVAELLRGGDLFLLPSASESFGLSALEAMACGVPVVATRQGGLPEVVVDGETGYLAAVGAVDEMTERALAVLQDGATHERMRSEEHTSELQSRSDLVCRLLLEKKKKTSNQRCRHTHDSTSMYRY